jgi:hypothetical protein
MTTMLDLGDIQRGVLGPRPSPYAGVYLLLRIDDPVVGGEDRGPLAEWCAAHPRSRAR